MIGSKEQLKTQVNNLIDTLLSDWNMVFMQRYFEGLKPNVKDKDDAALGFIYGMICAAINDYLTGTQQKPNVEDTNIVKDVFQNRLPEIKRRVCANLP
jgi:hypothetical protein